MTNAEPIGAGNGGKSRCATPRRWTGI